MNSERKETWMLHYGPSPTGAVTIECQDVEDGKRRLREIEQHMGHPVYWAEVIHTVTTVETIAIEVSE